MWGIMERPTGNFQTFFQEVVKAQPFPFQTKFSEELNPLVNVPTGLGKTAMVVVGWLWRRNSGNDGRRRATPRRLVYCLPMRALVEQTKKNAVEWIAAAGLESQVDVHVLMGGEERSDWDTNPERDAIIIGTQDIVFGEIDR